MEYLFIKEIQLRFIETAIFMESCLNALKRALNRLSVIHHLLCSLHRQNPGSFSSSKKKPAFTSDDKHQTLCKISDAKTTLSELVKHSEKICLTSIAALINDLTAIAEELRATNQLVDTTLFKDAISHLKDAQKQFIILKYSDDNYFRSKPNLECLTKALFSRTAARRLFTADNFDPANYSDDYLVTIIDKFGHHFILPEVNFVLRYSPSKLKYALLLLKHYKQEVQGTDILDIFISHKGDNYQDLLTLLTLLSQGSSSNYEEILETELSNIEGDCLMTYYSNKLDNFIATYIADIYRTELTLALKNHASAKKLYEKANFNIENYAMENKDIEKIIQLFELLDFDPVKYSTQKTKIPLERVATFNFTIALRILKDFNDYLSPQNFYQIIEYYSNLNQCKSLENFRRQRADLKAVIGTMHITKIRKLLAFAIEQQSEEPNSILDFIRQTCEPCIYKVNSHHANTIQTITYRPY